MNNSTHRPWYNVSKDVKNISEKIKNKAVLYLILYRIKKMAGEKYQVINDLFMDLITLEKEPDLSVE